MFQLVLDKAEKPEIKLPTSTGSWKKREVQKSIYFCFIDCVDHNNLWKILKEMHIPEHLTCLGEVYMQVRKQELELAVEKQTVSK